MRLPRIISEALSLAFIVTMMGPGVPAALARTALHFAGEDARWALEMHRHTSTCKTVVLLWALRSVVCTVPRHGAVGQAATKLLAVSRNNKTIVGIVRAAAQRADGAVLVELTTLQPAGPLLADPPAALPASQAAGVPRRAGANAGQRSMRLDAEQLPPPGELRLEEGQLVEGGVPAPEEWPAYGGAGEVFACCAALFANQMAAPISLDTVKPVSTQTKMISVPDVRTSPAALVSTFLAAAKADTARMEGASRSLVLHTCCSHKCKSGHDVQ